MVKMLEQTIFYIDGDNVVIELEEKHLSAVYSLIMNRMFIQLADILGSDWDEYLIRDMVTVEVKKFALSYLILNMYDDIGENPWDIVSERVEDKIRYFIPIDVIDVWDFNYWKDVSEEEVMSSASDNNTVLKSLLMPVAAIIGTVLFQQWLVGGMILVGSLVASGAMVIKYSNAMKRFEGKSYIASIILRDLHISSKVVSYLKSNYDAIKDGLRDKLYQFVDGVLVEMLDYGNFYDLDDARDIMDYAVDHVLDCMCRWEIYLPIVLYGVNNNEQKEKCSKSLLDAGLPVNWKEV